MAYRVRRRRRRNPKASITTTTTQTTRYRKGGFETPVMVVLGIAVVGLLAYSFLGGSSA